MGIAIGLPEMRAEATDNALAKLSEEHLWLFGHDAALDAYYTFFDYSSCSNDGDKVVGRMAQLARLNACIATVVTGLR